ncbi:MAG: response regulator transcription factor [Planctomycetota bacterium]|nr:response regulator transcription factor [Planctomycetota bacterium]
MRILLIEDSERLRSALDLGLRKEGFGVDLAADGPSGLSYARNNPYDVIVLDLMLPGIDGLTILETLRKEGVDTHVLILTARDTVDDRVRGLSLGADDYLVKPFAFDELVARIRALVRRKYGKKDPKLRIGSLVVDTDAKRALLDDEPLDLTPREYALLEFLATRSGQVVSRIEIEDAIYDERTLPSSNAVDSAICRLRAKIDVKHGAPVIATRRGRGYILEEADA